MGQGAYGVFLIRNMQVGQFIQHMESILYEAGFAHMEKGWNGLVYRGRAIWGSTGQALIVSGFIPFGSMIKEGNRYGAEYEVYQSGINVFLKLLVIPYMAFWDHRDIFLITQGFLEKMTDDEHCRRFLDELHQRIRYRSIWVEPYTGQM
jgi:hypothetical protein